MIEARLCDLVSRVALTRTTMDKGLPTPAHNNPARRPHHRSRRAWRLLLAVLCLAVLQSATNLFYAERSTRNSQIPVNAQEILNKCALLNVQPGPPLDFNLRKQSDRFVAGTRPTLIRNASIWTGRVDGLEVLHGDVLLDGGLIKRVGQVEQDVLDAYNDLVIIEAAGAWVSPGIVDMHSHHGVDSSPELQGAEDSNSLKGVAQPWLRALDGLNTHSDAYKLSIAGGITTVLVLPGSANAIGGQGVVIKLRPTDARTPTGLMLENPWEINGTLYDPSVSLRWRQMKYACGENPSRVYGFTRMDTTWSFRQSYETARKIKVSQDEYCAKATAGEWTGLGAFPEDLQWEALVDVLRGRVKVHNHCYETVDLDDMVRLTNEFKFSIAAFHHAHETYLVSDMLKKAYGHPPAVALFATNARYKREAYRGSEFAPRILAENGLSVIMKSDHPVLDSRFLLYEAQQAHYYGLPANLALASVTSTPATVMGLDHRIGYIKPGYDADIVLWDSHPLALGATPKQVWIDGVAQLEHPYTVTKPPAAQHVPEPPNFDKEAEAALRYEGLPPLEPEHTKSNFIVFRNVSSVYRRQGQSVKEVFRASAAGGEGIVVTSEGKVVCAGSAAECPSSLYDARAEILNLAGGAVAPGLVTYGSPLGLEEITAEDSTIDGYALDPLTDTIPEIIGGRSAVAAAVDGLQFGTRDALLAYRAGVTTAVVAPQSYGFLAGLSAAFSPGAKHKLEKGAIVQQAAALHISIHYDAGPSVSTQIAALRALFRMEVRRPLGNLIEKVKKGELILVVDVESADIMASLIELKKDIEDREGNTIKMTFAGASEAHLLAKEISEGGIGVLLTRPRPFPMTWEQRRIMPGLPLSETSAITALMDQNVTVGIGIEEAWQARNTRWDASWAALESGGEISKAEALALASVHVEHLLGVEVEDIESDLIATYGGDPLELSSKVVGIISPRRGVVDLL
ncbi:composite domain of metallo-dependent hydrolase [Daedalea quercina L-15889]|uniref:Composite domain of metallo-dependent hydrolase n=1 Tax=Daedalea quercina L-15889 TaxID=1314783 RepID=A0A165SIR6_9APHY|nr:composite domain of metallo-dependent hydrolase [Daedalea quercina L-15889]